MSTSDTARTIFTISDTTIGVFEHSGQSSSSSNTEYRISHCKIERFVDGVTRRLEHELIQAQNDTQMVRYRTGTDVRGNVSGDEGGKLATRTSTTGIEGAPVSLDSGLVVASATSERDDLELVGLQGSEGTAASAEKSSSSPLQNSHTATTEPFHIHITNSAISPPTEHSRQQENMNKGEMKSVPGHTALRHDLAIARGVTLPSRSFGYDDKGSGQDKETELSLMRSTSASASASAGAEMDVDEQQNEASVIRSPKTFSVIVAAKEEEDEVQSQSHAASLGDYPSWEAMRDGHDPHARKHDQEAKERRESRHTSDMHLESQGRRSDRHCHETEEPEERGRAIERSPKQKPSVRRHEEAHYERIQSHGGWQERAVVSCKHYGYGSREMDAVTYGPTREDLRDAQDSSSRGHGHERHYIEDRRYDDYSQKPTQSPPRNREYSDHYHDRRRYHTRSRSRSRSASRRRRYSPGPCGERTARLGVDYRKHADRDGKGWPENKRAASTDRGSPVRDEREQQREQGCDASRREWALSMVVSKNKRDNERAAAGMSSSVYDRKVSLELGEEPLHEDTQPSSTQLVMVRRGNRRIELSPEVADSTSNSPTAEAAPPKSSYKAKGAVSSSVAPTAHRRSEGESASTAKDRFVNVSEEVKMKSVMKLKAGKIAERHDTDRTVDIPRSSVKEVSQSTSRDKGNTATSTSKTMTGGQNIVTSKVAFINCLYDTDAGADNEPQVQDHDDTSRLTAQTTGQQKPAVVNPRDDTDRTVDVSRSAVKDISQRYSGAKAYTGTSATEAMAVDQNKPVESHTRKPTFPKFEIPPFKSRTVAKNDIPDIPAFNAIKRSAAPAENTRGSRFEVLEEGSGSKVKKARM
ncbi:hypothetical protein YB2330_004301 [Saitoella coloradoensis]